MIGGLIFLGFALQDLLPWIATAFAWAIYVFGAVYIPVRVVFIPPSISIPLQVCISFQLAPSPQLLSRR